MVPFISITDFMDNGQVRRMLAVLRQASGKSPNRKLGVGVMTSYKTLNGLPSMFTDAFSKIHNVSKIFVEDPLAFNVLHYADYRGINVSENLLKAVLCGGVNLDALQLDMVWPDPEAVKAVKKFQPSLKIILQINPESLIAVQNSIPRLVDRLDLYGDALDFLLLDMSKGQGKPMVWEDFLPYISIIKSVKPDLNFVVAGGLGPESLNLVEPLVKSVDVELSIDAQGKLRPSGSALDPIDWPMAEKYLIRAVEMFQRNQR